VAGRRARSARQARRRAYSQNFIASSRLAAELVADAAVAPRDVLVEIGAGGGRLTEHLARRGARTYAVELDPVWAGRLRERFAANPNVTVVEADVLQWSLPAEPFKVLANLPFHRTAAILRHLLDDPGTNLLRADLVVEWGAACKLARVWPSTQRAACWRAWFSIGVARRLPARCFEPVPHVDAGVLSIVRRERPLVPVGESAAYRRFVAAGFSRPKLAAGLEPFVPARRLRRLADTLAFPRDAAARELDAHQWAALWRALHR
jgi:23S rRNA (adenine-N6)-dimethyltransferase